MLLRDVRGFGPHPVVFGIGFSFVARDGKGHQAYGDHPIAQIEDQRIVPLVFVGIVFRDGDVPQFLQVANQSGFVPVPFGKKREPEKRSASGLILRILCVRRVVVFVVDSVALVLFLVRFFEDGVVLKTANELLEAVGQVRDSVVQFLVDVYNGGFALRSARAIVQKDHVVPGTRAVANGHTDRRVPPFARHESAAQVATEGIGFVASDAEDAGDRYVVFGPARRFVGRKARIDGNPAVMPLHKPDV